LKCLETSETTKYTARLPYWAPVFPHHRERPPQAGFVGRAAKTPQSSDLLAPRFCPSFAPTSEDAKCSRNVAY
jgi:hypothetical protein